jgi:hypothetical protein
VIVLYPCDVNRFVEGKTCIIIVDFLYRLNPDRMGIAQGQPTTKRPQAC